MSLMTEDPRRARLLEGTNVQSVRGQAQVQLVFLGPCIIHHAHAAALGTSTMTFLGQHEDQTFEGLHGTYR